MLIQVTLRDLIILVAFVLGVTISVLIISVLWNVKKMVSIVRPLLEDGQACIKKATKAMPVIIDNMEKISDDLRVTTEKLKDSLPIVLDQIECVAGETKETILLVSDVIENIGSGINETVDEYKNEKSSFMPYLHIFEEVVQIIFRTFSKEK